MNTVEVDMMVSKWNQLMVGQTHSLKITLTKALLKRIRELLELLEKDV